MIDIDIRGIAEVQRLFRGLASDQIDYALTVTLNGTAFATQKVGRSQLESSFNRPTPLIKGSTRVDKATKETLTARVFIDPKRAAIIRTHEEGGQRGDQRLEKFLRNKGWLPAGWRAVPTDNMPLNSYGNPKQAEVNKIINGLPRAGGIAGDRRRLFVIAPGLPARIQPGIYRVKSRSGDRAIMKLYHFVDRAQYQARLEWLPTVEAEAIRLLPEQAIKALQRAIETAR